MWRLCQLLLLLLLHWLRRLWLRRLRSGRRLLVRPLLRRPLRHLPTFSSLFVVVVVEGGIYVRRQLRRAHLPKNLQHLKVCEQIRRRRLKVQVALQRSAQPPQQVDKRFLLAPYPRTPFVLHLVRRHVHMDLDGEPRQRLEQAARRDPGVLGAAVAAVQPVHLGDARQQTRRDDVVGRQGFQIVELVDELNGGGGWHNHKQACKKELHFSPFRIAPKTHT